jgi:hypothetical protein
MVGEGHDAAPPTPISITATRQSYRLSLRAATSNGRAATPRSPVAYIGVRSTMCDEYNPSRSRAPLAPGSVTRSYSSRTSGLYRTLNWRRFAFSGISGSGTPSWGRGASSEVDTEGAVPSWWPTTPHRRPSRDSRDPQAGNGRRKQYGDDGIGQGRPDLRCGPRGPGGICDRASPRSRGLHQPVGGTASNSTCATRRQCATGPGPPARARVPRSRHGARRNRYLQRRHRRGTASVGARHMMMLKKERLLFLPDEAALVWSGDGTP